MNHRSIPQMAVRYFCRSKEKLDHSYHARVLVKLFILSGFCIPDEFMASHHADDISHAAALVFPSSSLHLFRLLFAFPF